MSTSLQDVLGTISTVTGVIRPFLPIGTPAAVALSLVERGVDIAQRLEAGDAAAEAEAARHVAQVREWNASSDALDAAIAQHGVKG